MISYNVCDDYPWFCNIRKDWGEDSITAEGVETDVVVNNVLECLIVRDNVLAIEQHERLWGEYLDTHRYVVYTDGLSGCRRSGAGVV